MTTRTVTGNIRSLTDSAVATGTVTFEKIVTSTTGSTIHQSGVTTATTDSSGDFSIALAVPASGSYRYRMILPNGASFYFSIASGASVNVATLIEAETITDQDAIVEALTAYLPLAGGTMTGAITLSGAPTVDLHAATKKYVDDNAGGGGASDVLDLTTTTGNPAEMVRVAGAGGLEYRTVAQVLADLQDSGALAVTDIGTTVQGYDADLAAIAALSPSNDDVIQRKAGAWTNRTMAQLLSDLSAKLNAINALTWASNSIIWLTGTATASVQALAAHIVTFLQSATAADARTAIGAGTGNGDVTAGAVIADNAIVRGDGGAKGVQSSAVTIDDNGTMDIPSLSSSASQAINFFRTGGSTATLQVQSNTFRIIGASGVGVQILADGATVLSTTILKRVGIGTTAPDGKIHSYDTGGGFLHVYKSGVVGSAVTVISNGTGDVTLVLSGTFTVSDGGGNIAGGVITATAPGGTFNLYDDGGTNTCVLAVAADGSVTVQRTAGARTYAVNLNLNWM